MPESNETLTVSLEVEEIEMTTCRNCGEEVLLTESRQFRGVNYCEPCHEEEVRDCDDCGGEYYRNDLEIDNDDGNMYCNSCFHDRHGEEESIPERNYSLSDLPEFQSDISGKYIKSQRIFSAEIECYYNDSEDIHRVADKLPRAIGISYDGSLSDNGVELQTPKLRGKHGEQAILKICKALTDNGHYVNRSTGLHIHLDGQGLMPQTRTSHYPSAIINLWSFYVTFEDVFLSFLPRSRRRNQYCALVHSDFHAKEIRQCDSLEALEKLWYRTASNHDITVRKANKYDNSRYMGVNLHSLFSANHLEIRYHSGTLNPVKILEWVNVHQRILDAAANDYSLERTATDAAFEPTLEAKTQIFFDALDLDQRSRNYFKKRQAMFSEIDQDKDEAQTEREEVAASNVSNNGAIISTVCAA